MSPLIRKTLKEVFERKQKQKKFWGKTIIESGPHDNKNEIGAMIELLSSKNESDSYISGEDYQFMRLFLDCKLYAQKIYDDFFKRSVQDENQAKHLNKFVNNNFDIIVLYALLNIKNPLDDKINNFQRFVI